MSELTPEELAQVAMEVTGDIRKVPTWNPSFCNEVLRRDQALAVVEWLCDAISNMPLDQGTQKRLNRIKLQEAVRFKEADELQRMVLELRTKS